MSNDKSISELLQQAEALRAGIQTGEELPSVHRNPQQIAEAVHRLLDKIPGAHVLDESTNAKASILLGSRGFDVPKLSQKLESLNAAKTLEPIEPVWETDIQGFLRNERENTLLAIVEESRRNTFAEAERHHWRSLEKEWENEKEKILNSLLGPSQELEVPSESKLMHTTPLSMQGRSGLDAVGMAYAREVYIRNESKLQKLSHNLVTTFHETSKGFVDKSITECWSLLKTLVDVQSLPPNAYEHRSSRMLQEAFAMQARHFLESSYLNFIQDTVYHSLSQAQLGGVPGTLSLVKSFLLLRQVIMMPGIEKELLDDQPLWALVFYCMRCGDMEDALNALRRTPTCSESDFASYLQEYIESKDHRLSPSSEAKLQNIYRCTVRTSADPFKRAVFCVIARCDVGDNHTEVCTKTDDYMWLKLSQLQFDLNDDDAGHTLPSGHSHHMGDRLTLSKLQHTLLEEFGETHFNAHQQPYLYFKVLLLTAQFEAAIEFLSRVELLHSHAIHFAIALHDMNLIHLTESMQSKLLVKDPTGVYKLNFTRLIRSYTKRFSLTDPREALHYFYLLKGVKSSQSLDLFNVCVSELVIESREFEMVLGRIQQDGSRKPGCVDKFEGDTSRVIQFVAQKAEEKGLFEDAVHLYDLAKDHKKVLELLNRLLSQVVSSPSAPQSDRDRLQSIAITIAERFKTSGHNATRQLSHTFFLLLDIMQFFDHYHNKRIDVAFDVIKQLHLLPLQAGETVDQKVAAFRNHDDEVRRCLPDTLLATMSILYSQYKQLSVSTPRDVFTQQDGGHEDRKKALRSLAKTLITFSGMIPYQMPGDTNARLVQMEVLMS